MSNSPFDRTIINSLEKPLSGDINRFLAELDRSLRFFAKSLYSREDGAIVSGFVKGGFRVVEQSPVAMEVILKAGLGFQDNPGDVPVDINGVTNLNDLESYKPMALLSDITIPIAAAPAAPNSRIDILEVRADRVLADLESRQIFDNSTQAFSPVLVEKTLQFLLTAANFGTVNDPNPSVDPISLKQGAVGNPGVAPATTPGYLKVCEIFVDGNAVSIDNGDITDFREPLGRDATPQTIFVPAALGQPGVIFPGPQNRMFYGPTVNGWSSNAGIEMELQIPVNVSPIGPGDQILAVEALVHDAAGAVIEFSLRDSIVPGTGAPVVSDVGVSGGVGAEETVPLTNINFNGGSNIVEAGHLYSVIFGEQTAINPRTLRVYGLNVTYIPA